jgi:hypothetical protein
MKNNDTVAALLALGVMATLSVVAYLLSQVFK